MQMVRHSVQSAWMIGLVLSSLAYARPVAAQAPSGFLRVNGVYPVSAPKASNATLDLPLYEEIAAYDVTQEPKNRIFVDATVGARIWQGLGAGVTVSFIDTQSSTRVSGSIPSPLIFDSARTASFSTDLKHRQIDIHLQAVYYLPTPGGIEVALSAGPSLLRVSRDSVSSATLGAETFPFETVSIAGLGTGRVSETGIGTNVGADIALMPTRVFGVGFFIRYVTGTVGTGSQALDVGGLHAGAGLRFHF